MKKLNKPEMIKRFVTLKKGIGMKSEKVCKQVRDQKVWKQVEDTAQGLLYIEWK